MIYTTLQLVIDSGAYCPKGMIGGQRLVEQMGGSTDTHIPIRTILSELSICDAVFCMGYVAKPCVAETKLVLTEYMKYLYDKAVEYSGIDTELYSDSLKPIRKRCEGHNRPWLLTAPFEGLSRMRRSEADPVRIHAVGALRFLAAPWPDALCATHASISLIDAADYGGQGDMRIALGAKLERLLT